MAFEERVQILSEAEQDELYGPRFHLRRFFSR